VSELRKQVSGVDFAISWTTRAPRGSEENGREYNFTSREEFQRMIDAGVFLEHAEVFGNYYGTARGRWTRRAPPATICCSTSTCRARRRCAPKCLRR
jgi:guanylate kinase